MSLNKLFFFKEEQLKNKAFVNELIQTLYLSVLEIKNKLRSFNIIAGIQSQQKEGHYIGLALKGYSNSRGEYLLIIISNDDEKILLNSNQHPPNWIQHEIATRPFLSDLHRPWVRSTHRNPDREATARAQFGRVFFHIKNTVAHVRNT